MKITNEEKPTSYLLHPDLDFYNWDVLDRFTHVELIAAMYPRPVCVEYGELDGAPRRNGTVALGARWWLTRMRGE